MHRFIPQIRWNHMITLFSVSHIVNCNVALFWSLLRQTNDWYPGTSSASFQCVVISIMKLTPYGFNLERRSPAGARSTLRASHSSCRWKHDHFFPSRNRSSNHDRRISTRTYPVCRWVYKTLYYTHFLSWTRTKRVLAKYLPRLPWSYIRASYFHLACDVRVGWSTWGSVRTYLPAGEPCCLSL